MVLGANLRWNRAGVLRVTALAIDFVLSLAPV